MFAVGVTLIAVASFALAAFILFTQTPTYTSAANLTEGCPSPGGTINGTLIVFSCGINAAIYVAPAATGSVSYASFTKNTNVTDAYLVDVNANPGSPCGSYTKGGFEPIALVFTGGTINIGTIVGTLRAGHAYNYCEDLSAAPPSFTFSIAWSQP
jgi:hypothetical protein